MIKSHKLNALGNSHLVCQNWSKYDSKLKSWKNCVDYQFEQNIFYFFLLTGTTCQILQKILENLDSTENMEFAFYNSAICPRQEIQCFLYAQ